MPFTFLISSVLVKGRAAMMASALAAPMPYRLISSSLLAVFKSTAPKARLASMAISKSNFFIVIPLK